MILREEAELESLDEDGIERLPGVEVVVDELVPEVGDVCSLGPHSSRMLEEVGILDENVRESIFVKESEGLLRTRMVSAREVETTNEQILPGSLVLLALSLTLLGQRLLDHLIIVGIILA